MDVSYYIIQVSEILAETQQKVSNLDTVRTHCIPTNIIHVLRHNINILLYYFVHP